MTENEKKVTHSGRKLLSGTNMTRRPALSFLSLFFGIPCFFFPLRGIPCFLSVFPFFSMDFRGSVGIKNPCFFGGFPCLFPKNQGKEGQGGYRTMEMDGGSSAPHLARSPCVPLFCTSFNRVGNKERFRLPGAGGGSFPLYGGTFARSYSVST